MGKGETTAIRHSKRKNKGNAKNLEAARQKITEKFIQSILDECIDRSTTIANLNEDILPKNGNERDVTLINGNCNIRSSCSDFGTKAPVQELAYKPPNTRRMSVDIVGTTNSDRPGPSKEAEGNRSTDHINNVISIDGKRLIDIQHFWEQIQNINTHAPHFGCSINNIHFTKELRNGLTSTFLMKCDMCNSKFYLQTNKNDSLNTHSVEGAMSIGIGYSNMHKLFSVMDVPYMNDKLYTKCHDTVCDTWQETAIEVMREAAQEEREHAISIGQLDNNGVPLVTVVADGCWSKRSYRTNYNASSGAAAIVGQHTMKVLFIGVKNKFCSICSGYQRCDKSIPEHTCYKNFIGSSTSMEAQSIVEGFRASEDMYGIRYWKMIADGDSSTYKRILESRPYKDLTVEKVECRNHLLRNYCNKLKALSTETRFSIKLRKLLGKNILRLRTAVVSAIAFRKQNKNPESVVLLKKDIDNNFYHVFGSHDNCARYFCKRGSEDIKYIEEIKSNLEFYNKLHQIISNISNHARSLIEDVDSNVVEQFNSIIAKFVGGKRINFSRRRSYIGRCNAAVVSFNSSGCHYDFYKKLHGVSPGKILKRYEQQKQHRKKLMNKIKASNKLRKRLFLESKTYVAQADDKDYGENCSKPDLDLSVFEAEKQKFLKNLKRSDQERAELQKNTIAQAESGYWLEERRKLLTASYFHAVCTRRATTQCGSLVKSILYSSQLNVPATNHGKKFEKEALGQLQMQENVFIEECGLFTDKDISFLGATPDGVVGNDLIVEVKCPYSCYKMNVDEAIRKKKIKFWTYKNHEYVINTHHKWYFQIQGQLHITGRKGCIFGVWTGSELSMKVAYILKRNDFWEKNMRLKLCNFYIDCILPELIDPRHTRHMPIREPDYLKKSQNRKRKSTKNV